jgi:hypothetical protein
MERTNSKQHLRPNHDEITEFKVKHDLTYKSMADICGVRPEAVRDWCTGRSSMPVPVWKLLKLKLEGVEV